MRQQVLMCIYGMDTTFITEFALIVIDKKIL